MPVNRSKVIRLKALNIAALLLELAFGYFIFKSLRENDDDILKEYGVNTSNYTGILIAIAAFFAFSDLVCNVTSIDPAQSAYESANKDNENDINIQQANQHNKIIYCGYAITAFLGYTSFLAGSCGAPTVLAGIKNPYVRWPLNVVMLGLGMTYYHMLSFSDLLKHAKDLYPKIFSCNYSIIYQAFRNPLESFELLLQLTANSLYRSVSFSYMARDFFHSNISENDSDAVYIIMAIAAFATVYGTLFTRMMPARKKLFPDFLDPNSSHSIYTALRNNKSLFARELIIRLVRSGGFLYFVGRYIDDPQVLYPSSITAGSLLVLHSAIISARLCNYKYIESENLGFVGSVTARHYPGKKTIHRVVTVFNIAARITRMLAVLGFMNKLNQVNNFDLPINDLVALTISLGIPIAISDFLYFDEKLQEVWGNQVIKSQNERAFPTFGKCFCYFFAQEEYGDRDQYVPLRSQESSSDDDLDESNGLGHSH